MTISTENKFFNDLYSDTISFKLHELFVIHQNSFFQDIVIYSVYNQKNYYLLDLDTNFPFLSRPERIVFNNMENSFKNSPSEEKFMIMYSSFDQGLKLEEISEKQLLDFKYNALRRNSFIIPKSFLSRINADVEKSSLLASDIVLWVDNEGKIRLKFISEDVLYPKSVIFLKGDNKFILRSRDPSKARSLFNYLNDLLDSIIKPQLINFRNFSVDLLQNLSIPLDKNILLSTILYDEPLVPFLDKIIKNISESLFANKKFKCTTFDKDSNKLKYLFYVETDDDDLISLYNNAYDLFFNELNKLPLTDLNKNFLSDVVSLDVIPYDSKLYG